VDAYVDFNATLRPDSETMFCIRALDDAMTGAGIYPQDVLIVDRALRATNQKIVVVDWNGRPMIRRLRIQASKTQLIAENVAYEPILITENIDFKILGVAIRVIHALP
jgi:DNA polymerase V